MPETAGERLAVLESQAATVAETLTRHLEDCAAARKESNERFIRLERVIWMATGAVMLATFVLKLVIK